VKRSETTGRELQKEITGLVSGIIRAKDRKEMKLRALRYQEERVRSYKEFLLKIRDIKKQAINKKDEKEDLKMD